METPQRPVTERRTGGVSWTNILLGVWLILAPFVLNYSHYPAAQGNDVTVGILVALVALVRTFGGYNQAGWSWLNVLFGVWLILAPFLLGYSQLSTALWNDVLVGALIAILAWSSAGVRRRI